MDYREFGNTGLLVSAIGFGAGHIGKPNQSEQDITYLIHELISKGVNLIDTARSYGTSEERIGKILGDKRKHVILSTKIGYLFRDKPDWSYAAIMGTLEESLQRLKTEFIDIVHLHSCDKAELMRGEAIQALEDATEQGKIRFAAYSGENDSLEYAVLCGKFRSIQCSVNPFDQNALLTLLPDAKQKGLGIIAKRPLGNAVWRYSSRPDQHGHALYYDRFHQMELNAMNTNWLETSIRFSAYCGFVDTIIIGSSNINHTLHNLTILEKGPLPPDNIDIIVRAFNRLGTNPPGLI